MSSPFSAPPGFGWPPHLQDYLKAAERAMGAGDVTRAMQISAEAAQRGIEHPGMLALAVHHFLDLGQFQQAFRYATRARELAPRQGDVLNALGQTLVKLDRPREAINLFDEALRYSPASFASHFNKAEALVAASELKKARDQYLRALALKPEHVETLTKLAHLAAQRGDAGEAREYGARALKVHPHEVHAKCAIATADIIERNYTAVLAALKPLADSSALNAATRATAQIMIGDALDALDKPQEAFAAYSQAGNNLHAVYTPIYARPGQTTASSLARKLERYFRDAPPQSWRGVSAGDFKSPVETHVFLLGFPRSGTTLLGQVLAAHPKMETMEERSCLDDSHPFVLEEGGLDRLASLDGTSLDQYRAAYWKRVANEWAAPSRPVFIDKLPLNSVLLCLIAKLFPDAKILFALRDPRDVVLSCFRRRFGMNAQMYELLTLQSAAAYYDAVLSLTETCRKQFSLDFFEAYHENLVSNFEEETRRLCKFLGVEHDPGMQEFAPAARDRHIDTPSAAQVARGLFGDGRGKWRAYQDEISPVMPILAPWVAHFGYASE